MHVSILGPLEVRSATGDLLPVAGTRVRTLLTRLAVDAGRPVPTHVLVDEIWTEAPPADPGNALQTLVSRLRRALGDPQLVVQEAGGYRLGLPADDVDAGRLTHLVQNGATATQLRDATESVRGPAAPELDGHHGDRLDEVVLSAEERLLELELRDDAAPPDDVVARARRLVEAHPLRENLTAQLLRALQRQGRTAEALAAYERTREHLVDALGADPGPALQALHLELLHEQPVPTKRTNLRAQLTTFLGREQETSRLDDLLGGNRLATIVGPGGAGKTRLAGVVANGWVDRLPDGVWFVELAPVTDPESVAQAFVGSLGLRASEVIERRTDRVPVGARDRLIDVLANARCLLVVDNCEHVVAEVAALVDDVLAACPDVRVLATSREPLGIAGESLYLLSPLTLPRTGDDVAAAMCHSSVQLFADRATAADGGFRVDDGTVADVVEIVRRLDGLPLAIELAAARLRVLPVTEIASRLTDRFRLLTGGSRTAMPRHRTLRAVVEWSWDLLSTAERELAERLAVFPSGTTVDAAQAVAATAGLAADDVVDLLDALVDKSLLRLDGGDHLRYRMLETLREYGIERLAAQGVIEDVRRAHATHYATLVHDAEPWLLRAEQLGWLRRLEAERDNVIAALQFLGASGDARGALRLVMSLGLYWTLLGGHAEATTWIRYAVDLPGEVDPRQRLVAQGMLALNAMAGNHDDADDRDPLAEIGGQLDEYPLARGDDRTIVLLRPMMAFFSGDGSRIRELMDRSLAVADEWTTAALIMFRGNLAENEGDLPPMRRDTERALEIFTRLGERWGMASCLTSSAQLHTLDGDLDRAVQEYTAAVRYLDEFGATGDQAFVHARLANLALRRADLGEARRQWELMTGIDVSTTSRTEQLLSDSVLAAIVREEGDVAAMRRQRQRLSDHLARMGRVNPLGGHLRAITIAGLAGLDLSIGDPAAASAHAAEAYPVAVATRDMPIVAAVGGVVAACAVAAGHFRDAAVRLGATARLQGRLDATDVDVRRMVERLRAELGAPDYEAAFAEGFALDRDAAVARLDPREVPIDG